MIFAYKNQETDTRRKNLLKRKEEGVVVKRPEL